MNQVDLPQGTLTPQRTVRINFPWFTIIFLIFLSASFIVVSALLVQLLYASRIIKNASNIPTMPVAIILGASITRDGTPSDALRDRIERGVELYKNGSVSQLLMSGDDGGMNVNEVEVMKRTAIDLGVPEEAILIDGEGYRTYESCKRAINDYHVTQAILVTQRFHLARALFLCNELGIDSYGFVADRQPYQRSTYFWFRDLASSVKAFWDIYIQQPSRPASRT